MNTEIKIISDLEYDIVWTPDNAYISDDVLDHKPLSIEDLRDEEYSAFN